MSIKEYLDLLSSKAAEQGSKLIELINILNRIQVKDVISKVF